MSDLDIRWRYNQENREMQVFMRDGEKIVIDLNTLPNFFIESASNRLDLAKNVPQGSNLLRKGRLVALVENACEGFEITERVYRVIDFLPILNGIHIDGVIVKQVSGEDSMIFSLTKEDCKTIGIKFEQGLQLFPINMNWQLPKSEREKIEEKAKKEEEERIKRKQEREEKYKSYLNASSERLNRVRDELERKREEFRKIYRTFSNYNL